MRRAIGDRPWIIGESGVSLRARHSNFGILSLSTALLIVALPRFTYAQQFLSYTVRSGDTLSFIAAKTLGDASRWKEISRSNPQVRNARLIFPGQKLRIETKPFQAGKQKFSPRLEVNSFQSKGHHFSLATRRIETNASKNQDLSVKTPVLPAAPPQPKKMPLFPLAMRLLDILCFPLALFGARQLWLDRLSRKHRIPLKPPAPALFWDHHPEMQEGYSFLTGH
ncbi:MAG TPA: hypothetical protein DD435_06510 [Cyanobacteria bacterium UBA8530]|nr:hypothetical protein [Cyanobacteria bacterium UBA8530]